MCDFIWRPGEFFPDGGHPVPYGAQVAHGSRRYPSTIRGPHRRRRRRRRHRPLTALTTTVGFRAYAHA